MQKSQSWAGTGPSRTGSPKSLQSAATLSLSRLEWPRLVPEVIRGDFHTLGLPRKGQSSAKHIAQVSKYFKFKGHIEGGENRGILLPQMHEIYHYAEVHWQEWKVDRNNFNLYDIYKWLITPLTKENSSSMVEHLAERRQAPLWYVCHWWGDPVAKFLQCVRQHFFVRDLVEFSAYWVSAFALRPHDPQDGHSSDSTQTSFFKAMHTARFKVLLVIDSGSETKGPGTVFKRVWCCFEWSMMVDQPTLMDTAICIGQGVSSSRLARQRPRGMQTSIWPAGVFMPRLSARGISPRASSRLPCV